MNAQTNTTFKETCWLGTLYILFLNDFLIVLLTFKVFKPSINLLK